MGAKDYKTQNEMCYSKYKEILLDEANNRRCYIWNRVTIHYIHMLMPNVYCTELWQWYIQHGLDGWDDMIYI